MPIFLPEDVADLHYNGFSNKYVENKEARLNYCRVLWPLLHYLPGEVQFTERYWDAYIQANSMFAKAILDLEPKDHDIIWIHDYHLFALPRMLRRGLETKSRIGFFLHTPFPSSEVFKTLPVRKEILLGVFASDLIGFHANDYLQHFTSSCVKLIGATKSINDLAHNGKTTKVRTIPIGIDPNHFSKGLADVEVQKKLDDLKSAFLGKKIILGVDRLDYIKGLQNKFAAFSAFLGKYPDYKEKVVLIQVAVPTRLDVDNYTELRDIIYELAGKCNGLYGSSDNIPLHLINQSVNYCDLCALYQLADICLITSVRDGMNLVALEYVASQERAQGTLMLSEFTGASQSLGDAITINPWDIDGLADQIERALNLNAEYKSQSHQRLARYVESYSALSWSESFINILKDFHSSNICPIYWDSLEENILNGQDFVFLIDENLLKKPNDTLLLPETCTVFVISQDMTVNVNQNVGQINLRTGFYRKPNDERGMISQDAKMVETIRSTIMSSIPKQYVSMPGYEMQTSDFEIGLRFVYGEEESWNIHVDELLSSISHLLDQNFIEVRNVKS